MEEKQGSTRTLFKPETSLLAPTDQFQSILKANSAQFMKKGSMIKHYGGIQKLPSTLKDIKAKHKRHANFFKKMVKEANMGQFYKKEKEKKKKRFLQK